MNAFKTNLSFVMIVLAYAKNVLFGAFRLINLINLRFQYFYLPKIINISILSPTIDSYIWIVSLVAIILTPVLITKMSQHNIPSWLFWPNFATLASLPIFFVNETAATLITGPLGFLSILINGYYGCGFSQKRLRIISWVLICIGIAVGIVEVLSLFTWVWNAFNYEMPFLTAVRWRFSWIDLQLFNLLYPWTTWLFVILLYSWIWIPLWRYVHARLPVANKSFLTTFFSTAPEKEKHLETKSVVLSLSAIVAIAVVVTSYAYIHSPDSSLVGSDAQVYYEWLNQMGQNGLSNVFQSDRPLTLLIMYTIKYFTTLSSLDTIRILPVICTVSLSLVVFWFVRTGTRKDQLALIAALFSVFSFQTAVGIYAYFLSNWFAIILGFVLLTCVLKSLQTRKWHYTLLASFLGMAMILIHLYTWVLTMALITVYVGIILVQILRRRITENQDIRRLVSVLVSNALFYAIYSLLPFGSSVGASGLNVISYASSSLSLSALSNVYSGIASSVELWVGGLFANPLLLLLAIAGMFALKVQENKFERFLALWIAIPSIILFTVSPENFLFHRILYLMPIQILAAVGLQQLLLKMDTFDNGQNGRSVRILKLVTTLVVLFLLFNYALRAVDGAPLKIV